MHNLKAWSDFASNPHNTLCAWKRHRLTCSDMHLYRMLTVGICSTVVEWATHMRMYAGSSPTSVDHYEEWI